MGAKMGAKMGVGVERKCVRSNTSQHKGVRSLILLYQL